MDAPAVAVTRNGARFDMVWMDMRTGANDRQIYWRIVDAKSRPGERPLSDDSKSAKGHPSVAVGPKAVHAAWEDNRTGEQRIWYRALSGDGKDVPLSPAKGKASFPSLACGKIVGVAFEYASDAVFAAAEK